MLVYIGFYRPAHGRGFDAEEMYGWENRLPVVDMNGNVTYRPCQEATYRQLIVSERLGLIDGDVTRPYICPSMPQGEFGTATEVVRVAADAARAAYAALEGTRDVIDDAGRVTLLYALWQGVKKTFKKPRKKKRKKEGKTVRSRRAKGRRKSGESGTH